MHSTPSSAVALLSARKQACHPELHQLFGGRQRVRHKVECPMKDGLLAAGKLDKFAAPFRVDLPVSGQESENNATGSTFNCALGIEDGGREILAVITKAARAGGS